MAGSCDTSVLQGSLRSNQMVKSVSALALRMCSLQRLAAMCRWEVQVLPASYISRTNKLAQLFALIFRRSSCQQPLLAGALGGAA